MPEEEPMKKPSPQHKPRRVTPEVDRMVNPNAHLPAVLESDLHDLSLNIPDPDPFLELPDGLPFEEWTRAAEKFQPLATRLRDGKEVVDRWDTSMQWRLGDVLVYGQQRQEAGVEGYENFEQYMDGEAFGYAHATANKAMWLARIFPPAERFRAPITFSHHAEVAAKDKAERRRWLERALKNNWSVQELKEAMRPKPVAKKEEEPPARKPKAPPVVMPCEFTEKELTEASETVYALHSLLADLATARRDDPDTPLEDLIEGLKVDPEIPKMERYEKVRSYDLDRLDQWCRQVATVVHNVLAGIIELKKVEAA